jgi:hypothetical protein
VAAFAHALRPPLRGPSVSHMVTDGPAMLSFGCPRCMTNHERRRGVKTMRPKVRTGWRSWVQ